MFLKHTKRPNGRIDLSLKQLLELLVYSRVLAPSSKLQTFLEKQRFPLKFDFEQHDEYRGMDHLCSLKDKLLLHIHQQVNQRYQRKAHVFYDETYFYFEIDQEDEFRKKGCCKHHTKDPLVQMGLLFDQDAIPITHGLFKGKTDHRTSTLVFTMLQNQI